MTDRTPHQRKIIERYYSRRDEIMLARLGDIVPELYLATGEGALNQLWRRAAKAMSGLKIPARTAEHILDKRDPEILARYLRRWLDEAKGGRRRAPG